MDQLDALMCVLEGRCPKCKSDLKLTEVGGTSQFLYDHYGSLDEQDVLEPPRSEFYSAAINILDCSDKDLVDCLETFQKVCMTPKKRVAKKRTRRKRIQYNIPAGVTISKWDDKADELENPYEIGVQVHVCSECGEEYEAYALVGGDWSLAGHPEFAEG